MNSIQLADAAVSFGPFLLQPGARLLERDGKPVHVGGRALDILILLAERAGEVVSKKDLVARVWSDVHVDEGSLRFHITALRKALGDGTSGARYVTNVPGRGYCLVASVSRTRAPTAGAAATSNDPIRTLPARLVRMVGRDETAQALADAIFAHRFVTIAGPGGIGKTTIATATGHSLASAFQGRVSFVDLGPLSEPRLVSHAVASTLGASIGTDDPLSAIVELARESKLLLILDGCEHLIDAVAGLAEALFNAAPLIHILATSRESLRVEGEHVHRLFPLQCPPQGQSLLASEVLNFSAAQLFLERVTAASDDFELADADASAVADICHRLDGIPLAIELAAARADAFGIRGLAKLLDERLLTSRGKRTAIPRHQTLKATLDWSYERLPKSEQILLNRLSVFQGAFNLAATLAVCSDIALSKSDIADGVIDLVSKSLLAAIPGAETTYRLLDTTRHYAIEKLEEGGEQSTFLERHARYVSSLFARAAKEWNESPSVEWLFSYRMEIDNLRAALKWSFSESGDKALGVALTIAAVPLWSQLSLVDESLESVERALSHSDRLLDSNRRDEMELHAALGGLQMYAMSSVKQSNNAWENALKIATELGESDYQLRSLRALWAEAINGGEARNALSLAEKFQDLAAHHGSEDDKVVSDRLIGTALHFMGDQEKAQAAIERMLSYYIDSAARSQVVRYQFNQKVSARLIRGRILWLRGRTDSALRDIQENVAEAVALDHTMSLCNVVTQTACPIALLAGEQDVAERYIALLLDNTQPRALDVWRTYAICFQGALEIERGNVERGLDCLQPAMEKLRRCGFGYHRIAFLMTRVRGLLLLDRDQEADEALTDAISICGRTGERWCMPELHRLNGEIILKRQGPAGSKTAVQNFERALTLAREQQALAWELRAATSMARCEPENLGTRSLLQEVYSKFTEGGERPELVAAASLLKQQPERKGDALQAAARTRPKSDLARARTPRRGE